MKLIYCPLCHDIVKIRRIITFCECGESFGAYQDDGLNAMYAGAAVPLGIANLSFTDALKNQPKEGMGERFEAFVIPLRCPTFKRAKCSHTMKTLLALTQQPDKPYHDPQHPAPDEETTFGGTVRKTGVKRGPHPSIQPRK